VPPAPGTTELVVTATTCGDGLRTGAEECDDANVHSDDGCSSYCVTEAGFACKRPAAGGKDECSAVASPPAGSVFISASIRLGASMTPEQFVGMCGCVCVCVCLSVHKYIHIRGLCIKVYIHTYLCVYYICMYVCVLHPPSSSTADTHISRARLSLSST
jgi:cysteine-rich repeat protein